MPASVKCRDYAVWMSYAKVAELIEMPFGWLIRVGPRNIDLDGGEDLPTGGVILWAFPARCRVYLCMCFLFFILNLFIGHTSEVYNKRLNRSTFYLAGRLV